MGDTSEPYIDNNIFHSTYVCMPSKAYTDMFL